MPGPGRPFVIMNPRSGGGKVARFGLQRRAEELGAEVALLDRPGTDVQQLARDALARGADLLGVAGGDGTQALVAQVAAEHDVPFMVISAGTRNHFALDLGLDRDDPARCLDALRDGVEARIDLGDINGRPFVNNASFGAYAEIVEEPRIPRRQARHHLECAARPAARPARCAPGRRGGRAGRRGPAGAAGQQRPLPGLGSRRDGAAGPARPGVLGVIAVRVETARQAVGLIRGAHRRGLLRAQGSEVVVNSDEPTVPVGIDGETVQLSTPVRCTVRPRALRVRLPRERPGIRAPRGHLDWASLWGLAVRRRPSADAPAGGITGLAAVRSVRATHGQQRLTYPGRGELRRRPASSATFGRPGGPAAYTFFMVAVHREVEKKYAADEAFELPPLTELVRGIDGRRRTGDAGATPMAEGEVVRQKLSATYFDTADLRLALAGLTCDGAPAATMRAGT